MSKEFEPYSKKKANIEFNVWEYQSIQDEPPEEINEQERFLAECELLRQEAKEKGYAEGWEQAQADINDKKKEFARWFDLLQNPIKLMDEEVTQELIQTLIWLCQYCLAVELSINPDKLHGIFDKIKEELPSLNKHRVFVMHPLDVEWVKTEIGEKEIPGLHDILAADPSLNRGDFYLKGEHSELDGRMQVRLATLFAKYLTQDSLIASIKVQD